MVDAQGLIDSNVMKPDNILVKGTTIKLTKDNYLYWAAAIKMAIARRWYVEYMGRIRGTLKIIGLRPALLILSLVKY